MCFMAALSFKSVNKAIINCQHNQLNEGGKWYLYIPWLAAAEKNMLTFT